MRRFVTRLALFLSPIALYVVVVLLVDPFERFGLANVVPFSVKWTLARATNHALWTVIHVDRDTLPNILLGDSKMGRLDVDEIRRVSGKSFANFAMDGASASDIADLFWRAAKQRQLREVVVNLSLDKFNRGANRDIVRGAERVASNPMLYVWNRDVLKNTIALVRLRASGSAVRPSHGMTRDEFWKNEMTYGPRRNFGNFHFDTTALGEFARVAEYCERHAIRLRFVILPTHADVHRAIEALGYAQERAELPNRLRALAETIDLDIESAITADREAFSDPIHMRPPAVRLVVEAIFRP